MPSRISCWGQTSEFLSWSQISKLNSLSPLFHGRWCESTVTVRDNGPHPTVYSWSCTKVFLLFLWGFFINVDLLVIDCLFQTDKYDLFGQIEEKHSHTKAIIYFLPAQWRNSTALWQNYKMNGSDHMKCLIPKLSVSNIQGGQRNDRRDISENIKAKSRWCYTVSFKREWSWTETWRKTPRQSERERIIL